MSTLICLIKMLATVAASFLFNRLGRKVIIEMGGFLLGIGAALISLGFYIL